MPQSRLFLQWAALAGTGFIFLLPARGQPATNEFQFNDYLLVPVRVHLLSAKDSPAVQTTLAASDINRILAKLNTVWEQAGLYFYLESLVNEEANHPENYTQPATE